MHRQDRRPIRIAPSILAGDFARLGAEVRALTEAGADRIHVDVMDGHFVPNITIGPAVVAALRGETALPLDVHLMVRPAERYLDAFAEAGADTLYVHPEAGPHVHRALQRIRALGKRAGVALNPDTPATAVEFLLDGLDAVLVMTVNPGFGGQTLITGQLAKIAALRARIDAHAAAGGAAISLEADGGIDATNAPSVAAAGAEVLVAGTAVFAGAREPASYAANIAALRAAAPRSRAPRS